MTRAHPSGYFESAQVLLEPGSEAWSQAELLHAAETGELRNTGWPLGLVIRRPGLAPVPAEHGIEARLDHYKGNTWDDYWHFSADGSFYLARLFEEDYEAPPYQSSDGHPEKPLWFDIRLWRIAEAILHSSSLYQALGVPATTPYLLTVNHLGLNGRELSTSHPRRHIRRGRICHVDQASWRKEVTQDLVTADLKSLVFDVASQLFVLFDFFEISEAAVDQIVDEFLGRHR